MIENHRTRVWLLTLLCFLLVIAPFAMAQDDEPPKDQQVGEIVVKLKPKPVDEESGEAVELPRVRAAKLPVRKLTAGAETRHLDWQAEYRRELKIDPGRKLQGDALSRSGQETLAVARAKGYSRQQCISDLQDTAADPEGIVNRSLDVGRHEVIKAMFARALHLTEQELREKKKSPLKKIVTVNSGGTGDYTRDQDVTCFAGDPSQEEIYFKNLGIAAKELGLKADSSNSGTDFPEIEVTVFRGGNDLPDARFATDVREFQLKYTEGIQKQILNPESYIGGGADVEVKGKRRPGQIHAQEFTIGDTGKVGYRSEIPGNQRETRAIFTGTAPDRHHRWQLSAHIFNNFLQGYRHGKHPGEFNKGSLKYTGRAIERLCELYGKLPWPDLPPEERLELLSRVYPQFDPHTPNGKRALTGMAGVIDTAYTVLKTKNVPDSCTNPDAAARAAQIFLRRAVETTSQEQARQMLDPPHFQAEWITGADRERFDAMNPEQRWEYLEQRQKTYRECVSIEAMENLVVTMAMLRQIDLEEGANRGKHGEVAIRQIIENAEPSLRPILTDVSEYSRIYLDLHLTPDPAVREQARADLADTRQRIGKTLGEDAPGLRILAEMERMGPQEYLKREMETGRCPSSGMAEVKARFAQHIKDAFPSMGDEVRAFRADYDTRGPRGYVAKKLRDEVCQLDTIADGLQIVEMYQNGAGWKDYTFFAAVNVLSRFHWSFSHFIAAGQMFGMSDAQKVEAAECLAKNLIFATFARVIPWAATAKVVFDIAKGIVTITVGYSINVVNADMVDAVYTGEAGRLKAGDGPGGGRNVRDSGFCVLPAKLVVKAENEKTGEPFIWIDRVGAYRYFFRQWTGLEAYELPGYGVREEGPDPALAKANDTLARLFYRQAEKYDRVWVSTEKKKRYTMMVSEDEAKQAILAMNQAIEKQARATVRKVLAEGAFRSYRSIFQKEGVDVIEEGLVARLTADVFSGMLEFWESYITAQVLAMRDVERTAMQADLSALGGALGKAIEQRIKMKPDAKPELTCMVDVRLFGEKNPLNGEFDARVPIRVSAFLKGVGDVGEHQQRVKFEVGTVSTEVIEKGDAQKGPLLAEVIKVRAIANQGDGPVLAESRELRFFVRKQPEVGEDLVKRVPLMKHEVRRRDGALWQVYTYLKAFSGMPMEWGTEYGQVYHGKFEEYQAGEVLLEERNYEFGVLNGVLKSFDNQGRLVHEMPYVNGVLEGTETRYDPDTAARFVAKIVGGEEISRSAYGDNGTLALNVNYEWSDDPETGQRVASGQVQTWWSNGNPKMSGSFDRGRIRLAYEDMYSDHAYGGKTGTWEWFFKDGAPRMRTEFARGVKNGVHEVYNEQGGLVLRGHFVEDVAEGDWEYYYESGMLKERGARHGGKKDGVWEEYDKEGNLTSRTTFKMANLTGPYELFWSDGSTRKKGAFLDDSAVGEWVERDEDGAFWRGPYVDGERHGKWVATRASGKLEWERTFEAGKLQGESIDYHENGSIKSRGAYEQDGRTGEWTTFHEKGGIASTGSYDEGDRTGAWKFYFENGQVMESGSFKNDKKLGRWEAYHADGRRFNWSSYNEDGELVDSGFYDD